MMKIFSLIFLLFGLQVVASVSCDELNRLWKDKYYDEFHIAWEKQEFSCPSDLARIVESFYYLENIKFRANNSGYAPDYYTWIKETVPGFTYEKKDSNFPDLDVIASSCRGCMITLFDIFAKDTDVMSRVRTIIHEGRHTQLNDPGHSNCTKGAMKGKYACDNEFVSSGWGGSGYNYGFRFLWWLHDSSYGHDLARETARYKMQWSITNRFNHVSNEEVRMFSK